jgi:hypothetical protein
MLPLTQQTACRVARAGQQVDNEQRTARPRCGSIRDMLATYSQAVCSGPERVSQ